MESFRRFTKLTSVDSVKQWLTHRAKLAFQTAQPAPVPMEQAPGRILSESLFSSVDLPPFRRAMMDGIAIRFADYKPDICWTLISKSASASFTSEDAKASIQVQTGMPLPDPWDTVVPIERLKDLQGNRISSLPNGSQFSIETFPLILGSNVARIGEDIQAGDPLFAAGRRIRIQDIGLLAALGIADVKSKPLPKVEILVTGDELCSSSSDYFINDANGPTLEAFLRRDQGQLTKRSCLEDDRSKIEAALLSSAADVVLVSGGTSVGPRDHSADIVSQKGHLHFHGIDMRPGKPMGVGEIDGKLIFLLPGNPVACQFAYELLVRPYLRIAAGGTDDWPYQSRAKKLVADVASKLGRVDYLRVKIEGKNAQPITSGRGSNLSSVTRADGFVIVSAGIETLSAGSTVDVFMYD